MSARVVASVCCAGILSACTNLNIVHDPQFGAVSKDQLPGFLKSLRCELKTFVANNQERMVAFQQLPPSADPSDPRYSFFPMERKLFGGAFLDLKVVDTAGIGAGDTGVTQKDTLDAFHTRSWIFGPTLNAQNTYGLTYTFLIDQSRGLWQAAADDPFQCFDTRQRGPIAVNDLAYDRVPGAANFTRILVNGTEPLAAWLQDNSATLWTASQPRDAALKAEQIAPVQMSYSFAVQLTGGVSVKYLLTSPVYTAAQVGGGVSAVQTSQIQIFFNGKDAKLGPSTKIGQSENANPAPLPGAIREAGEIDRQIARLSRERTVKALELNKALSSQGMKGIEKLRPLTDAEKAQAGTAANAANDEIRNITIEINRLQQRRRELQISRTPRGPTDTVRGRLTDSPFIQAPVGVPGSP